MRHHRRLAALAFLPALFFMASGPVGAATPAARFTNPPEGVTPVVTSHTFTATWAEDSGIGIATRRIAVQGSRSMGAAGCDPRWVPVVTVQVDGTSYTAANLADGRCFRFLLVLDTALGRQTITSASIVTAAGKFGPQVTFTNPIKDGLVAYDTSNTISWIESDSFGARIVSRSFVEQSAATATDGGCAGVSWRSTGGGTAGPTTVRTLARGNCYRYVVTLTDTLGFRATATSPAMRIATELPPVTDGKLDLYRADAYATQATMTWCVAASVQMMINLILGTSDTSAATQKTYIDYAQANDAAAYPVGSDPQGWVATLNRFGGGGYYMGRFSTSAAAIKTAALRMRLTHKPVGLLVMSGSHAWVMTGFRATADPATTSDYTVTSVLVAGPLYPRPANSAGYDPAPDTELTIAQFAKYFKPYYNADVRSWNGTYIVILP